MLPEMKFQHIGMAVNSIDATAPHYVDAGYKKSESIVDPIQNIRICWLTKPGEPTVELLEPVDDKSPVVKTLEKNGVTPYHICYTVDDIDDACKKLRKMKYMIVSRPTEAVAFCGSKVCFLYHKDMGLIELVESPAKIID